MDLILELRSINPEKIFLGKNRPYFRINMVHIYIDKHLKSILVIVVFDGL